MLTTSRGPDVPATAASHGQRAWFIAGVAALWLGADGPIDRIGETYLFSVHMIQMLTLTLVAPPMLLLGLPGWLLRRMLRPRAMGKVVSALAKPLVAAVIFNAVLLASAWPTWVDQYLRNDVFHLGAHVLWVTSGLLWWWALLSPLPERPHLSYPGRMVFVLAQSFLPTVPAAFLTYGTEPMYRFYIEAPRLSTLLTPIQDQQIAGLIMKLGGGALLWAVLALLFFRWSYEERTGAPDWVYWRDVGVGPERSLSGAAVHEER